ncbi:enoyl-CoA hydratase [Parvularcula sp. LCG005]|uniref:enoyl-CoA hydratase n=1 Tax=Parvularcula sp. LCG005 TaxID=3078805 RepID=UPI002943F795|nr:enoyl-CoA hydratase [Parvularcula sp. LCG005]WOI54184.1 enoyl-CoA hydratase [Parvularcula sp. LCG005]
MAYEMIDTRTEERVHIITLSRPEALNALNRQMMDELTSALVKADAEPTISVIVITGSERAFAAGADIKEMSEKTSADAYVEDFITKNWEQATKVRKPIIAAVAGYALGGGCELAMMCDFIIAADNAKFGQPEITIGAVPGAGGTQRLTRAIGKAKAMEMCLTGRMMTAEEAERSGLVARVVPASDLMTSTLQVAGKIAEFSKPVAMMVKECVNRSFETSLSEGVLFERRAFQSIFALEDQKEGMRAFVEKRQPIFKHK